MIDIIRKLIGAVTIAAALMFVSKAAGQDLFGEWVELGVCEAGTAVEE